MSGQTVTDSGLEKLRSMIKEIDLCMLTTVDAEGRLHSRPMSNNREVEFDGDLWFFTYDQTGKTEEIQREQQVNVSFSDPKGTSYVSLSGTAEIIRDREKMAELWQPHLKAWFPHGLDEPNIALIQVTAHQAEYWDGPSRPVAMAISLAARVRGKTPEMGENKKLDLDAAA